MSELDALVETVPLMLDGKEYRFAKIDLGILADFSQELENADVQRGLALLTADSPAQRVQYYTELLHRTRMDIPTALDRSQSPDGLLTMLWLCMRQGGADVTKSQVGHLMSMSNAATLNAFVESLGDITPVDEAPDEGNATATAEGGILPSQPSVKSTDTPPANAAE